MDRTGVDVIRVLFVCLFVCLFVTHHFVWCGGASLAAVDSEPEWLWQVGNRPLYTRTVAAPSRKGRTGHTGESPSWSSCSVLQNPLFPPPLIHRPSSCCISKIWSYILGSVKADMAFSDLERRQRRRAWEARGRILARCRVDRSPRVQVAPVRKNLVCVSVLSVWGTFRVIT